MRPARCLGMFSGTKAVNPGGLTSTWC